MMAALDELEISLQELASRLRDCRAEIVLGGRIDLAGLDSSVEALCEELIADKPESQRFLPQLNGLVAELDALHAA